MASPPGSGTMPLARPTRPSAGQASRTIPQTGRSPARCCVFRGRKLELLKGENFITVKSQIRNRQAHYRVNFKYTAESPAASVRSSTTNTDLATQAYRGNTVSYLHYLERKIKVITSKVDSYKSDLENEFQLLNSKKSVYAHNLDKRIHLLIAGKDVQRCKDIVKEIQRLKDEQESHASDLNKKLNLLNDSHTVAVKEFEDAKATKDFTLLSLARQHDWVNDVKDSDWKTKRQAIDKMHYKHVLKRCTRELDKPYSRVDKFDKKIKLLNAEKDAHNEDLGRQIQLLTARKDSLARILVGQIRLLNARKNSYAHDLDKIINRFHEKKSLCDHDIGREHEMLESKLAPFAGCLDRQLELLHSKLVSCGRDFNKQQHQLDSIRTLYFLNVDNKMKLLNKDMTSCLGRDIQHGLVFNLEISMVPPPGGETMPPARPTRHSTGQASRTNPQTESSAARCIKNTETHNSVNFKYTAESSVASVPSSTTNTDLVTHAYRGNTAPYLHYLERKIKVIISKIDSHKSDLKNEIKLLNSKTSSYARNLDRRIVLLIASKDSKRYQDIVTEIQQLKDKQESHACDLDRKLKLLNGSHAKVVRQIKFLNNQKHCRVDSFRDVMERLKTEEDSAKRIWMQDSIKKHFKLALEKFTRELGLTNSEAHNLDKEIKLLNVEKDTNNEDLGRQIQLLSARKDSLARNLVGQIRLLKARKNSYAHDLDKIINRFHEKKTLCDHDIGREHELLESKLAPFAGCLDRQLEQLHSKLVSSGRDFNKQQNQLDSISTSYFLNVDNKMKLMKSDISYLGRDIQLLK